jgi:GWxTD domain-containing protein
MVSRIPMRRYHSTIRNTIFLGASFWSVAIAAQQGPFESRSTQQQLMDQPTARYLIPPCFEAQNRKGSKQLEDEAIASLSDTARAWLTEDVTYMIEPEERCAFLKLDSDDRREKFVEQFWNRRNPIPDSVENLFKEEHYRRIAFANEKFETQIPGWKTDRGRICIGWGAPDKIESFPRGVCPDSGSDGSGKNESCSESLPLERWQYRYMEGVGPNVSLEFVDADGTGNYQLRFPPDQKDDLVLVPIRDSSEMDENFRETVGAIARLNGEVELPEVKFGDLQAMVAAEEIRNEVWFNDRVDYLRATHASTVARMQIDIPEGELVPAMNGQTTSRNYEVFGEVNSLSGQVVDRIERSELAEENLQHGNASRSHEIFVGLLPGHYRLTIVVKDVVSGRIGVKYSTMDVPGYEELNSPK